MVDMGVAEQDRIDRPYIEAEGLMIEMLETAGSLEETAVDKKMGIAGDDLGT